VQLKEKGSENKRASGAGKCVCAYDLRVAIFKSVGKTGGFLAWGPLSLLPAKAGVCCCNRRGPLF